MTRLSDERAIVGIDPTPRGLAFVFFEGGRFLDWGTSRKKITELETLQRLLERWTADVLIIEDPAAQRCERRPRIRALLRSIERHARKAGVEVVKIPRYEVRQAWLRDGIGTKQGVAKAISAIFPELEPLVPQARKVYGNEEARTQIFDAASLVLHAFGAKNDGASEAA